MTDGSQFQQHNFAEDELILRENFVSEYLKDFDPFQAAIRVGFQPNFAVEWGKRLFQDTYVQQRIVELTRKPALDSAAQELADRALLENTLREAMQRGPYASRVTASKAFAELKGWSKPDGSKDAEQALIDVMREFAARAPV